MVGLKQLQGLYTDVLSAPSTFFFFFPYPVFLSQSCFQYGWRPDILNSLIKWAWLYWNKYSYDHLNMLKDVSYSTGLSGLGFWSLARVHQRRSPSQGLPLWFVILRILTNCNSRNSLLFLLMFWGILIRQCVFSLVVLGSDFHPHAGIQSYLIIWAAWLNSDGMWSG